MGKTRENGAFYGSRPAGNAEISIGFSVSDRQTGNERKMPIKKRMGLNSLIILKQIVEKVPERMSESFLKHALSEALRGRYLFEEQLPTRTHDLTKEVKKIYSPFYSLYAIMLIGE
ncbi:hypothetical protein JS72_06605 [Synergistes jonesii]|uniref:Transposase n=1 Tax=Synergistes jonesii TaxID=2754 RepID=A0A073IUN4_9BACT|nr:hypothetical protein [Synergistes jonesii]KEJ93315.1 hypothetical protein EH55_10660 [Synergistes jonesii]OFB63268.1 hypothetical protein JS72_06605 [Synergistes jonesii]OFB69064.1 hypothetical protein JS78_02020 [Synergistes jonesii]OFB76515.1 hypothetical protein JS77_02030 [Synergistes jonesii]